MKDHRVNDAAKFVKAPPLSLDPHFHRLGEPTAHRAEAKRLVRLIAGTGDLGLIVSMTAIPVIAP